MKKLEAAKLFHRSPNAKKAGAFLLFPAISIALVWVMLLVDTSWAWFVCSSQSAQTIRVANFYVTISVTEVALGDDMSGEKLEEAAGGGYQLTGNTTYQVVLEAFGMANRGYCIVSCGEKTYVTQQLIPGQTLVFTIIPTDDSHFGIIAFLGYGPEQPDIRDGSTLGEKKPEPPEEQTEPTQEGNQDSEENKPEDPNAATDATGETMVLPEEAPAESTTEPEGTEPVPGTTLPVESTPETTQPPDQPEGLPPEVTQPEDQLVEVPPEVTQPTDQLEASPSDVMQPLDQPEALTLDVTQLSDQPVELTPEEPLLPKEQLAKPLAQLEEPIALAESFTQLEEPIALVESVTRLEEPIALAESIMQLEEPVASAEVFSQSEEPIAFSRQAVEPRLKMSKAKEFEEEVKEEPVEGTS